MKLRYEFKRQKKLADDLRNYITDGLGYVAKKY